MTEKIKSMDWKTAMMVLTLGASGGDLALGRIDSTQVKLNELNAKQNTEEIKKIESSVKENTKSINEIKNDNTKIMTNQEHLLNEMKRINANFERFKK